MDMTLTKEQIYDIKKFMAFVLRHKPFFYHVKLDGEGYAPIEAVLRAISKNKKIEVTQEQLVEICKRHSGGIFLVKDDKIKAREGHTVTLSMNIPEGFEESKDVPQTLYCLLDRALVGKIMVDGGLTLPDTKVTLSPTEPKPIENAKLVTIHAKKALKELTKFYANSKAGTYYARFIAARYLSVHV
jgi:RNA:NAD 2'-phosphotransferase (TPT1/KptA family)